MLTSSGMRSVSIYRDMSKSFNRQNDITFAAQNTYISSTQRAFVHSMTRPGLKEIK